ncbi:adenosylcobinamide-GDP ribazoletransferase [Oricola cellulosilytica]|nr:adenosylcobinamide-GDP ribazoletransferase [Oricola cellulosilytica]
MRSISFLSRLPVPQRYFLEGEEPHSMHQDSAAFPLAGIAIALLPAFLLMALSLIGLPPYLSASFAVLTLVAVSGAFHEDGLADVADGFGGGSTTQRRLEIMKDSRIGAFGALALTGGLLLRVGAVGSILEYRGAVAASLTMIAVAAGSRAAIVWFWANLPSARPDGLAGSLETPSTDAVRRAGIVGLSIFAILATTANGFLAMATALVLAFAVFRGFEYLCRQMIGGQTGDTLGACQQLVEIASLAGLASRITIPT